MRRTPLVAILIAVSLSVPLALAPSVRSSGVARMRSSSAGATGDWSAHVRGDLERQEYIGSATEDGWQAPNRAQNLRTRFRSASVELAPRVAGSSTLHWGWETTAWGRAGTMRSATPTTPLSRDARIEYRRDGLVEWYENRKEGLEQGFTLATRPEGEGRVRIEGRVAARLHARANDAQDAVDFVDEHGARVLRYGDLMVRDARGTRLDARLDMSEGMLTIEVDDRGAAYPVTIDPLLSTPSWTAESDQDFGEFGVSVATAGDVNGDGYSDVVVGAYGYDNGQTDEGRAYLYLGSASGLALTPAWTAESNQANAFYGISVSAAGDVNGDGYSDVVAGASRYDNGAGARGRAYLYLGSASGLAVTAAWTADGDQTGAEFAGAIATAGDVNGDGYADVIAGAQYYDNGQSDEGRAYLYLGSASGLALSPAWSAESNMDGAGLGNAVATAGDVNADGYADVIVGVYHYSNGQFEEGRALVYLGSASGLALTAAWNAESDQAFGLLGNSVATAGDVNGDGYADVIVGVPSYDNGQTDEGRAYVYLGSASGVALTPAWTAESDLTSAQLGLSVATAGDINGDGYADVIVGAPNYSNPPLAARDPGEAARAAEVEAPDAGETSAGRAFVYLGSATGLAATAVSTINGDQAGAILGYSVATAGDVNGDGYSDVIVGAPNYSNAQSAEGRAYLYLGSASGPAISAAWTAESDSPDANFGYSVAVAGDVNGDGYSDVIVGAYNYTNGQANEGRAYVYLGSATGLGTTAAWSVESNQPFYSFGCSVAASGDVNGDGFSDVIVGANRASDGEGQEGIAFVYLGSASGLALTPAWTAESNQAGAFFGSSVATAGDVNGDGYSDVIVGAPFYDNVQNDEGRVFVYLGSASGLSTTAAWIKESDQADAYFGACVATAGDVNGDGYSDVIIGAPYFDNGQDAEGRAFVYFGSDTGLAIVAGWTAEGDQAAVGFGHAVGTAGDVNGDGYSDIIVGAPVFANGQAGEGRAFVYLGSASGLATSAAWTAESDQAGASFGGAVHTAGDVNDDGYSDIIVGAQAFDNGLSHEGRAFVYFGSPSGLATSAAWTVGSNQLGALFGYSVATAGDANGDGYSDVIVGAEGYDNGQTDEGRAYLFFGNGGDGLDRRPRQLRPASSRPISLLGKSASNAFNLRELGRTPAGRGNVRMEWEARPIGTAFSTSGHTVSSALNTGAPVVGVGSATAMNASVSGLSYSTPYHWRLRTLTDSPLFPRSPWVSLPYNNSTETDLRTGSALVGVSEPVTGSEGLRVEMIRPNPSSSEAAIRYVLPRAGEAEVWIHDLQGRRVAMLANGVQSAGTHTVIWDGRDQHGNRAGSGVYWVRVRTGGEVAARKLVRE